MTKRNDLHSIPSVSKEIYVDSSFSMSHGRDDVLGGLATVTKVEKGRSAGETIHFISVKEHPGHGYNWEQVLAKKQEELKEEFGSKRARPIPDKRPEFNSGSTITQDNIRHWLEEGKKRGATHVIVMSDTYDFLYYPIYVMPEKDPREAAKEETGRDTSVKEVYSLSGDIEAQLAEDLSLNYD